MAQLGVGFGEGSQGRQNQIGERRLAFTERVERLSSGVSTERRGQEVSLREQVGRREGGRRQPRRGFCKPSVPGLL